MVDYLNLLWSQGKLWKVLTQWSAAVQWSHLNRTLKHGPSSPPASHTQTRSLAGNTQSHCKKGKVSCAPKKHKKQASNWSTNNKNEPSSRYQWIITSYLISFNSEKRANEGYLFYFLPARYSSWCFYHDWVHKLHVGCCNAKVMSIEGRWKIWKRSCAKVLKGECMHCTRLT